ncbi:hypothetical protein CYMTET_48122 [Cymbomonas tetramitiformis]|uniref:AAA+ ATPase domain-containing protein n=1 Tax=Cymbomonas tetramitiformis TaxID=36881 RepID=A0AAE0BUH6_9CHLO|nr:hypothetical protein CYMTET_48122 [Cymbomonas tetramitiformis]
MQTLVALFKHAGHISGSPSNTKAAPFFATDRDVVEDLLRNVLVLYHKLTSLTHAELAAAAREIKEYSDLLVKCLSTSISTFPLLLSMVQSVLNDPPAPELLDGWIRSAAKSPSAVACLTECTTDDDFMVVWNYVMDPTRWQPDASCNSHQTLCVDLCRGYFGTYLDSSPPRRAPLAQAITGSEQLLSLFRVGPLWRVLGEEPAVADTILRVCTCALSGNLPTTSGDSDNTFLSYITNADAISHWSVCLLWHQSFATLLSMLLTRPSSSSGGSSSAERYLDALASHASEDPRRVEPASSGRAARALQQLSCLARCLRDGDDTRHFDVALRWGQQNPHVALQLLLGDGPGNPGGCSGADMVSACFRMPQSQLRRFLGSFPGTDARSQDHVLLQQPSDGPRLDDTWLHQSCTESARHREGPRAESVNCDEATFQRATAWGLAKDETEMKQLTYTEVQCVIASLSSVIADSIASATRPESKRVALKTYPLAYQVQGVLGIPPVPTDAEGPGRLISSDELVMTPTTTANVQRVLQVVAHPNASALLEGGTGVGKSATVACAARLAHTSRASAPPRLHRFNMSSSIAIEDLVGRVMLPGARQADWCHGGGDGDRSGPTFTLGPFARAYSEGHWLLLDELNLAPDEALQCIQSALDGDTRTLPAYAQAATGTGPSTPASSRTPHTLQRHPDFRLFATQNPGTGAFRGMRMPLSEAFLDRFHRLEFLPLGPDEWRQIVRSRIGGDDGPVHGRSAGRGAALQEAGPFRLQAIADRMVSFHRALQTALQPPAISSDASGGSVAAFPERGAHTTITIRELLRWSQRMKRTLLCAAAVTTADPSGSSAPCSAAETDDALAAEAWSVYGARFGHAGGNTVRRLIATELLRDAGAERDSTTASTARLDALTDVASWSLDGHGHRGGGAVVRIGSAEAEGAPDVDVALSWREEVEDRACQNSQLLRRMDEVHRAVRRVMLSRDFVETHGLYPVYGRVWLWDWVRAVHNADRSAFSATPKARSAVLSPKANFQGALLYASRVRGGLARDCVLACFKRECQVSEQKAAKELAAMTGGCPAPRAPFVATERVLQLWRAMCASLAAASRGGDGGVGGAPEALLVMGRSGVRGGIQWHDGVVTTAYKAGAWLILDNLDEAEPAVTERLNPVLESPPVWSLGERSQPPAPQNVTQGEAVEEERSAAPGALQKLLTRGHGFLVIGTVNTSGRSAHCSVAGLSPALANRFTQIFMADMVADGTATGDAVGECPGSCKREIDALVGVFLSAALHGDADRRFAASFVQAVWGLREATIPGITFRTIIRLLDATSRTWCPSVSKAAGMEGMAVRRSLWAAFQTTVLRQAQPAARSAAESCVLERLRSEGLWHDAAIRPEIPRRQLHLRCSATSQVLTPSRCALAEAVLATVATGCPVLLEGPAARRSFQVLPRAVLAAVEDGHWFLADELNLAPGGVLSALMPLLEGQGRFLVPGKEVEAQVHPGFRFFATQNPSRYAGRQPLPTAVRARFLELQVEDFPEEEVATIISERRDTLFSDLPKTPPDVARQMAKVYHGLRASGHRCTMRELIKWVRRAHLLQKAEGGGRLSAEGWAASGLSLFLSELIPSSSSASAQHCATDTAAAYRDSQHEPADVDTVLAVRAIVEDAFGVNTPQTGSVSIVQLPKNRVSFQDGSMKVIVEGGRLERCPLLFEPGETGALPASVPEAFRRALVRMAFAVAAREPVLLAGPTSFKTKLVETWATVFQQEQMGEAHPSLGEELSRVHLTTDTEGPELIGQIQPVSVLSLLQQLPELVLRLHARCAAVLQSRHDVTGSARGSARRDHHCKTDSGLRWVWNLLIKISDCITPQLELLVAQFVGSVQAAQLAHTRQAGEARRRTDKSEDNAPHEPIVGLPPVDGRRNAHAVPPECDPHEDAAWGASSELGSAPLAEWSGEEAHTLQQGRVRGAPGAADTAVDEDDVSSISSIRSGWSSEDSRDWEYDSGSIAWSTDAGTATGSVAWDATSEQQERRRAMGGSADGCPNDHRPAGDTHGASLGPCDDGTLQIDAYEASIESGSVVGPGGQETGGKDLAPHQARAEEMRCHGADGEASDSRNSSADTASECREERSDDEADGIRHGPAQIHVSMSSALTLKLGELLSMLESMQQVQRLAADSAVLHSCARVAKMVDLFNTTNAAGELDPWYSTAFIFRDGPVTIAARLSRPILLEDVDQPSQAVAERLNSLLETEPTFSVAEDLSLEVGGVCKEVELLPRFHIFATASVEFCPSPGSSSLSLRCGLSPAMRSRFTAVAVPEYSLPEMETILTHEMAARMPAGSDEDPSRRKQLCGVMMQLWVALEKESAGPGHRPAGLLPLLRWIDFLVMGDTVPGGDEHDVPDYQERLAAGARFCLLDHLSLPEQEQLAEEWWRASGQGEMPQRVRAVFQEPKSSAADGEKLFELRRHGNAEERATACRIRLQYCGVEALLLLPGWEVSEAENVPTQSLDARWGALVPTATLVMNVARIFAALALRAPLLLEGPPGVGKTEVVRGIARLLGNRCERLSLSGSTTVEELFGCFVPRLEGGQRVFGWQDGKLSLLLKGSSASRESSAVGGAATACWVLLDELNLASPDVLECLAPLFARDRRPFVIPGSGEVVRDHDIRWFATTNPASTGGGRRNLPRALQSAMVMVRLGEYSEAETAQIAQHMFHELLARGHLREDHVQGILAVHHGLRRAIDDGEVSVRGGVVNLRDIRKLCAVLETCLQDLHVHFELYLRSEDGKGAPAGIGLIVYALRSFVDLVYGSRFDNPADTATLSALRDKCLPMKGASMQDLCGRVAVEKLPGLLRIGPVYLETGEEQDQEDELGEARTCVDKDQGQTGLCHGKLVHSPTTVKRLELMAAACRGRFGMLLEVPTCSGKTSLVKELARLAQRKLLIVPCNQELEASHLIGQLLQVSAADSIALATPEEAYRKWVEPAINSLLGDALPWLMQQHDGQCHPPLWSHQQLLQQLAEAVSAVSGVSSRSGGLEAPDMPDGRSPAAVIQCAVNVCKLLERVRRQLPEMAEEAEGGGLRTALSAHTRALDAFVGASRRKRAAEDEGDGDAGASAPHFEFVEGNFVQAVREGSGALIPSAVSVNCF